jgi:hypothetical protein
LVLRRAISLPLALEVGGAVGAVGVLVVYATVGDPAPFWKDLLDHYVAPALEKGAWQGRAAELEQVLSAIAELMTGAVAAGSVFGLLLGLLLGRWWQSLLYNPGGFGQEFQRLRLHRATGYLALAAVAAAVLSGMHAGIATDLVLVVAVLYVFQGISVVHGLVKILGGHLAWLVGMYSLLALVLPQMLMVLAGLGYADSWIDLRGRAQRVRSGRGS